MLEYRTWNLEVLGSIPAGPDQIKSLINAYLGGAIYIAAHLSHLMGKPTMWFPNRSNTNRAVQAQKRAKSLKFRI